MELTFPELCQQHGGGDQGRSLSGLDGGVKQPHRGPAMSIWPRRKQAPEMKSRKRPRVAGELMSPAECGR